MAALPNARHERFAQALASGMGPTAAYVTAGYKANAGNAGALKNQQHISTRVQEILGPVVEAVGQGLIETLTLKQRLISALYQKALDSLPVIDVAAANEVKALVDSGLALDKDQRVVEGGSGGGQSEQSPQVQVNIVVREVDEIFARARTIEHKEG